MQNAAALMFAGEKLSAKKAKGLGLIFEYTKNDELMPTVITFAEKLAKRPTKSIGLTKQLLNQALSNNLIEQLEMEKKFQAISAKSNDHIEGIKAFFEKRTPEYKGN